MFNSPMQWCPVRTEWVPLDEGVVACAQAHDCKAARCPLVTQFAPPQPKELDPRAPANLKSA